MNACYNFILCIANTKAYVILKKIYELISKAYRIFGLKLLNVIFVKGIDVLGIDLILAPYKCPNHLFHLIYSHLIFTLA